MRDPARIDKILSDLGRLWRAYPDLRLGQIVAYAVSNAHPSEERERNARVFNAEDDIIAADLAEQCRDLPPDPDPGKRAVLLHVDAGPAPGENIGAMVVLTQHDCLGTYAAPVQWGEHRFVDILADADLAADVDDRDRVRIRLCAHDIATIATMIKPA